MIYKIIYTGDRIKYGYTGNIEKRNNQYKTHTGDLIEKVIEFRENLDKVDEACIHSYLENILHLKSLGRSREVYQDPGDLEIIDSDLTLETFYRHLKDIEFMPGGNGKIKSYLRKRLEAIFKILDYPETKIITEDLIKIVASLFESLYLNKNIDLSENIFIKAKIDSDYLNYIMSLELYKKDILDIWFKGDWRKIK